MDMPDGPARLKYLSSGFEWIEHGSYVVCAVTGRRIPVRDLRYWSVELQEPYASAEAALERHQSLKSAKA